jgi:hypothetical protein
MATQLKVKILENVYETNYPTVGQCIDIKRLEMTLSGNKMAALISSDFLEDSEIALDIKGVAVMSILFPQLKKDLKTNSLLDLRYDDWTEILGVFSKEVFPWFTEWRNTFRKFDVEKELDNVEDNNTGAEG